MIEYLLLAPLLTGIMCAFTKSRKQVETVSIAGSITTLGLGLVLVYKVFRYGPIVSWENSLFADAFSAYIVLIVSLVVFVASIY